MDFNFGLITAWITFGIFGIYVFRSGKREAHALRMILGLALMGYPYFVTTALWNWLIGCGLMLAVYFTR